MQAKRVIHEYEQTNEAAPERVFPLLCPVREADWVPGWQYRLVYSQSGVAELGCVFTTPNEDGSEATWMCVAYEPPRKISYVWMWPAMVATRLDLELEPAGEKTRVHVRYAYTALSERGAREVERYDRAWFETKMKGWEAAINHYLRTGTRLHAAEWE